MIDETKLAVQGAHQNLVVFSGVLARARALCTLLAEILTVRTLRLPEIDLDRSFKSSDLWRRDPDSGDWHLVPEYCHYVNSIGRFAKTTGQIHCFATTDRHLAGTRRRVTFRDEQGAPIRNQSILNRLHSAPFVNWLKRIAVEEQLGEGILYVMVDGSEDLALDPGVSFRLSDLNRSPSGGATEVLCPTSFDIFVEGDKRAPFRDALIVPDFLGNYALHKCRDRAPGYADAIHAVMTTGRPFHVWSYDYLSLRHCWQR